MMYLLFGFHILLCHCDFCNKQDIGYPHKVFVQYSTDADRIIIAHLYVRHPKPFLVISSLFLLSFPFIVLIE